MSDQEASELHKCQTWVLKVFIHCEGCKKQVKKVLNRIDGVYTTSIEAEQNRVTVSGNFNIQTLIEKLNVRTGKHAELWQENRTPKEKTKPLKATCNIVESLECDKAKFKREEQCQVPKKHIPRKKSPKDHDSQYSNDQNAVPVDLSHIVGNMYPIEYQSHLIFNGIEKCYDDPSSQYKGAAGVEHTDQVKATYLNSLHIFSDENANACFIM